MLPKAAIRHWRRGSRRGCLRSLAYIPLLCGLGTRIQRKNSDFKADVRSLSFPVDLNRDGTAVPDANVGRQDFSMQNTTTLPHKRLACISGDHKGTCSFEPGLRPVVKDKLRVLRTLALVQVQSHQPIRPCTCRISSSWRPFRLLLCRGLARFGDGVAEYFTTSTGP